MESKEFFVLRRKAVPEVLLKVVEAKNLLESRRASTVQEAIDAVGISRSSFYKYKEDIFRFQDNAKGKMINLSFQMEDEPGLLSDALKIVSDCQANVLTIHQSIPVGGVASLSLSIELLEGSGDISHMLERLEAQRGVFRVRLLAKE